MKEILKSVISFTLKTVILLVFLGAFIGICYLTIFYPAFHRLTMQQDLSVQGNAQKYISPDLAVIDTGAYFTGTNASTIKKEADTALNGAHDAVVALGVPATSIQSNFTITPKYDSSYQNITGYTAHTTLEVRTKDFTLVDKVLDAAQANKLNLVDNITFTLEDPNAAREQLREAAIADAQSKATKMAQETGMSLGKVINVSEGYDFYPVYNNTMNDLIAPSAGTSSSSSGSSGTSSNAISPGQTQISMTVTLTYETN